MRHVIITFFLAISLGIPAIALAEETVTANGSGSESIYSAPQLQDGQTAFNTGNYELAFSLWQTLATQGHSDAQVFVGLSYANGWGVNKSIKLASHWYQKAAKNDNASGQFLLGIQFISDKNADLATGVMWLKRAAKNGDTSAQGFLKKANKYGWFDKVRPANKKDHQKTTTIALVKSIGQ